MPRTKNAGAPRVAQVNKYDANNTALKTAYGAFADLRRELADSRAAVEERKQLLDLFATCQDSQRAWLLLEDYFSKLALARRDFAGNEWWPRLMAVQGRHRLEETALLFLRNNRPLPNELSGYANFERLAEIEQAEQEQRRIDALEQWLLPPQPAHLDSPRAHLRAIAKAVPREGEPGLHELCVEFTLFRPRSGEKPRTVP